MITTGFDSRVKVQQIVQNHLPEYLTAEFPKVTEFLKQYYISQEYQAGPVDIAENLDQYLKLDNLTPEVINGKTNLSHSINDNVGIITVSSTKGYPSKYGLLKIDDEIITYTGITTNTFTGCVRGFSGITEYSKPDSDGELQFSTSSSASHSKNSIVTNLSALFLQEFYKKLKYSLVPGLESTDFYSEINVNSFIKSARSFYQSKGTPEAIRILFKLLYGVKSKVVNLEDYLLKPSFAKFNRVKVISAELISGNDPFKLVGQTIRKSTDYNTQASVSSIEIYTRKTQTYYKISLFLGYDENELIDGVFTVPGKTKVLENTVKNSSIISVDSTIGFPVSGTIICGNNIITYTDKTVNQFLNCSGITEDILIGSNIRFDEVIYGYEDGDVDKKVEFRITSSISDLIFDEQPILASKGDVITVKNIGEVISNPDQNKSYKEIFANSFIYNTSSTYFVSEISGSIFYFNSKIDKSSLKTGDYVDIISLKSKNVIISNAIVNFVNETNNSISLDNISGFLPSSSESYGIRRKLNKANSNTLDFKYGNNKLISDVQNLYVEGDKYAYVASNSLPSYELTSNLIYSQISAGYNSLNNEFLQGFNDDDDTYSIISFGSDVKFITGDRIAYIPENNQLIGLDKNETYYVEVLSEKNKIRLYFSRSFIGSNNFVTFKENQQSGYHKFILYKDKDSIIGPQKILKKFTLDSQSKIFINKKVPVENETIGMLVNGVEILNPKSNDRIYYGPLSKIQVLNGGKNYDVVNPPKLICDSPVSSGTTALMTPVVSGNLVDVLVDPHDFAVDSVLSLSIEGGNGKGTILSPVLDFSFNEVPFDARSIFNGGGLDFENDAISFQTEHNFKNGEEIIYSNNGNPNIGIGTYSGSNENQNKYLSNGTKYYAKIINPKSIKLYPTQESFNLGISTVGLTTINNGGIHKFRTLASKRLKSIKIIDAGSSYENKQLYVSASGISTYTNSIVFDNHKFNSGDIVNYSYTNSPIIGLSSLSSYYVIKLDDSSFRLSDAGIGATITENYQKNKYVSLKSVGSGYHIFKYPEIKVSVKVSYADTYFSGQQITATPVVKGKITDVYLYENGSGYGSNILNFQKSPGVQIQNGEGAEVRPVVREGKIIKVNVLYSGKNYYSTPDLVINGKGVGCILRAVVVNRKISKVIIINEGTGYDENNTTISVVPSGTKCILSANVRSLTVNNKRFGDEVLIESEDELKYSILGYNQKLFDLFSEDSSKHSKIIGWSYDGNPIYGPYAYSDPYNSSSEIKTIQSGYSLNISNIIDRPSGFELGFFVEDYKFTNSGDLDEYNGRYCQTPDFPDGVYAYFTSSKINFSNNQITGEYPFFIGNFYRSELLSENNQLNQYFDFNNSNLSRNTLPYKVNEKYADNEFLLESNEIFKQKVNITSISKGPVDGLRIENAGKDYKIGDVCIFENTSENGGGLNAFVSEITGKDITSIETSIESYENVVLEWTDSNIIAKYSPYHTLRNNDIVDVSGVTTSLSGLKRSNVVGVNTETVKLITPLSLNITAGYVEDIEINPLPPYLKIDNLIKIENEILTVLDIFNEQSTIRVKRSDFGLAHATLTNIDLLPNEFTIKSKVKYFDSKINKKVYFNPSQSVGIGTTPGVGIDRIYKIGNLNLPISVQTQTIYIPNHPFKNGQEVTLKKRSGSPSIVARFLSDSSSFNIPPAAGTSQKVYVINKSKDHIGLTTQLSDVQTTNGLFLLSPIPDSYEYSLETNFNQVKSKISKINSKVSVSTSHNLLPGDLIKLNVVPNTNVGIGSSVSVRIKYNLQNKKLLINQLNFSSSNVDISENIITINGHDLNTGNKIFYTSNDSVISGLSTGEYYIYKIDQNKIQFSETYIDSISYPPNIIKFNSTGGNSQKISLINPKIEVSKNSSIVFDVSDSSLNGYQFKIYSDQDFNKEYFGTTNKISVVGVGTIGISPQAKIYLKYNENYSGPLYYSLEKNGEKISLDVDVIESSKIIFVNNLYNGKYNVYGIGSTYFTINLNNYPEKTYYTQNDCDVLNYSTTSKTAKGGIEKLNILNRGYNYDSPPILKNIISNEGKNALIVPYSNKIGNINGYEVVNQGFEYFSDKTLKPEAYIYPVIFLSDSYKLSSIEILDGGNEYFSPPNLLLKNVETKEIIDSISLSCKTPYGSVSEISINAPIYGLSSSEHEIISIDNGNGVGISSIITSSSGVATCTLITPILNGFIEPPFAVDDEIFVENIINEFGTGYNSSDYNYQFFKVTSYDNTNPAVLEFNVSGLTTNPGIAKSYQSGYASIINKNKYPKFKLNLDFSKFFVKEQLLVNVGLTSEFFEVDLYVEYSNKDYIKVSGNYAFELEEGSIIKGKESGVLAKVSSISLNRSKFNTDYSNQIANGWINDIGKLDEIFQVIPNNDYYQNLSYTIKSPIEFEKFINPVNRLVHVSGLKNFGDLQIENKSSLTGITSSFSGQSIVLDVFSEKRVDTINNYMFVNDFDVFVNENGEPVKSRFLKTNKSLIDYIECISNRVLGIDDISNKFANKENEDRKLFTDVYNILEGDAYLKYLVQVIDITNNNYSLGEIIILVKGDNVYTFERSNLKTKSIEIGDFYGLVDEYEQKVFRFVPSNPYDFDYDIKFIQSSFTNLDPSLNVGINTLSIGCIDLMSRNTEVGIGSTETLLVLPKNVVSGFVADVYVFDSVKFDFNLVEVVVDHDGENTFISEYYLDNQVGISTNYLGSFDAKIESNNLYLTVYNKNQTKIVVNSRIVGFGKTTSGIGTSRFLISGQPAGSERSARYQSNLTFSSGISTVLEFDSNTISSLKSLVRVSYGKTSSIHQVICIQDKNDIYSEQYPFLSVRNESGIGTFGGEFNGSKTILKFYPDNGITDRLTIQSYNELIYTFSDYYNESLGIANANTITFENIKENVKLAAYDAINGPRANKLDFDANYEGTPIYKKIFNPEFTINYGENTLSITNHFFNTGEQLIYKPVSSFIGVGQSAIRIQETLNSSGILTTYLPNDVYAIRINEDILKLASTRNNALSGIAVTFVSSGEGNAHELEMTKKLEKSVISIDGIVQKPLSFTKVSHKLANNYGNISVSDSYFSLSGISSIQPTDVLKIDDELMLVVLVGIGTSCKGPITPGIGTFPIVNVKRGFAGTISTSHNDFTDCKLYRGSFNISGSKIWFTQPPRGSTREVRGLNNLPFPTSTFAGRVFLRKDYTTNTLYDDISSDFTSIDRSYRLTVNGINTTGIETGSGIVFINGVFQTPSTENNSKNNYELEQSVGITSIIFTGITSTNGDIVNSIYDINQNQLPRGGLIVSLGSTQGLGFAPLVGASVTAVLGISGNIVSIGIGTTGNFGSGYNKNVSIGITDPNHSGNAAVITTLVGAGGTLTFNIVSPGSGYVNPIISIPEPSYENLEIIGVSRRGIGNTTESGKNMLISVEVGQNSKQIPPKFADAAYLIESNKQLIAEVAVGRMLASYSGFSIPGGNQNCIDDIVDVLESICYNLRYAGNDKVYTSAKIYIDNAYLSGEEDQSVYAFEEAKKLAIQAMRNETIVIGGYSSLTQYKDNTIIGDVSGVPGVYGSTDCADVASAIGSFVGIVTNAIKFSTLPSKTIAPGSLFEVKNFKIERSGYGFQPGDVFKPVGLVTAKDLVSPLEPFELTVIDTFTDSFSAWQFGELDYIDSIKNLQNGVRKRFPLYYKGNLLSFETNPANTEYPNIDLNQVLLIFVNGVIQQPSIAFDFEGGSSFVFKEPPTKDANIAIFFYRGTRGSDSKLVNVKETLKIGDSVSVRKLNNVPSTKNQNIRTIQDFPGPDLIQTEIYTEVGINEIVTRPMDWIKQKRDLVINGDYVYKTRKSLEGQIYPTAKIIKDVSSSSQEIFVDNSEFFIYEEDNYGIDLEKFGSLIINSLDPVSAAVTAIVSVAGTIQSLDIVNSGYGYTSGPITVKIAAPKKVGVGVGTVATAIVSVVGGSITTPITITNPGFGYDIDNPPEVIVPIPSFNPNEVNFERISQFVPISQGFSGIVTGITTSSGVGGHSLAIKFYLRRSLVSGTFNDFEVGYPIYIFDTSVGSGVTSVDFSNSNIVGIGTTFVDNVYYVHNIQKFGPESVITCNIHSQTNIVGINSFSNYLKPIGQFSWGKLSKLKNPVSIGVSGLTVDSGLSSFPTIQRRAYYSDSDDGIYDTGSIRNSFN